MLHWWDWIIPFGINNVGATLQREMDIAFRGVIGHSVVVYLAHVVALSKKIKDHMFHLKQIFDPCKKYGISLNPKKCVFAALEGRLSWSHHF